MNKLLTVKQLSELLQVKVSRIYHWTHTGMIPHIKLSRNCVRFKLKDVLDWLAQKQIKGRTTLRIEE